VIMCSKKHLGRAVDGVRAPTGSLCRARCPLVVPRDSADPRAGRRATEPRGRLGRAETVVAAIPVFIGATQGTFVPVISEALGAFVGARMGMVTRK